MLDELLKEQRTYHEDTQAWLLSYADLITNLFVFFAFLLSISTINQFPFEAAISYFQKKPKYSLLDLKKEIDAIIQKHHLEDRISTAIGTQGLEIDFSHSLLFHSGESKLLDSAKPYILTFIEELRDIDPKWRFVVEGHTDDQPIYTPLFPSNWELSTYRAMEFLNFLRAYGVQEERIQLRGFAHTKPKVPNADDAGIPLSENRAKNRRVTLKIY